MVSTLVTVDLLASFPLPQVVVSGAATPGDFGANASALRH